MAFSFGFYDSKNGDRKYDAQEFSSIFDGVIKDGVYMDIGDHFNVTADNESLAVYIGTGRGWFDHTWTLNTSTYKLNLEEAEVVQDRIDAIVLDVDHRAAYRRNTFMYVKGKRSTDPVRPDLINEKYHKQYALAYVYVKAQTEAIRTANITNVIGTSQTPFVTGIIQTISIDTLIAKWEAEWNDKLADNSDEFNLWFSIQKNTLGEDTAGQIQNEITWSKWTLKLGNWSTSTVANLGDGQKYYTYVLQLNEVYIQVPQIDRCNSGNNTIQTIAEAEGFTRMTPPQGWAVLDTEKKTITFYAQEKPEANVTIRIQGVS